MNKNNAVKVKVVNILLRKTLYDIAAKNISDSSQGMEDGRYEIPDTYPWFFVRTGALADYPYCKCGFASDPSWVRRNVPIGTMEQLVEILENGGKPKEKSFNIGENKVIVYGNGDVRFGCTLVKSDDVNTIIVERDKLLSGERN